MASAVRLVSGSFDFSNGVDSGRVTTVVSAQNPNGLPYNSLAWQGNSTVRGGGISPRFGYQQLIGALPGSGLFQCQYLYEPLFANPYLMISRGGRIYSVLVEPPYTITDLTAAFPGTENPSASTKVFMAQGERFLVIQAGDITSPTPTLPLFWDGVTLRRSMGIVPASGSIGTHLFTTTLGWVVPDVGMTVVLALAGNYDGLVGDVGQYTHLATSQQVGTFQVTAIGVNSITIETLTSAYIGQAIFNGDDSFVVSTNVNTPTSELPAAGPMVYYQGRLWYANGRTYTAGDIVRGPSGTLPYRFTDSILKVTENPLAIGGDGFTVPDNAGNITALTYTANQDTSLGQGPLYPGTRRQIYSLQVPVTRDDWIAAGNNNQPVQTIAQIKNGFVNDRGIVRINGDLFYQTLTPAIQSLFVATRFFQQWGNVPISRNENRVLGFVDRSLMDFVSGIEFDNRLLETTLPFATPVGVACRGIIPLDFDIISSFGQESQRPPPAWEGLNQGVNTLQLSEGDFGGRQRAFSTSWQEEDGTIGIWELTDFLTVDMPLGSTTGNRVQWYFETPAYDFGKIFELKKLDGAEIWIDQIYGTVDLLVEYRTDADNCWQYWAKTSFCSAKNDCEAGTNTDPTCSYPTPTQCTGMRFPITIGKPQEPANCITMNKRPATTGYQFQLRATLKGYCRVRGILLFALPVDREPFKDLSC